MGGEEAAEKKLHDAASQGNLTTLQQLLREDPHLLDRVSFACSNRTPLHTAALQGNLAIVKEVLSRNPQLAQELDSQRSSPLHIAAAQGYIGIASLLLSAASSMCWSRDCHGMYPVHIAAMNGHVEILKVLLWHDWFPAMERLHRGETILHLCVKHRQLTALEVLVEKLGELVCAKDDDGETILHLAVRYKQVEIMKYLVEGNKIKKEMPNSLGKTALDILNEYPYRNSQDHSEMKRILMILSKKSMLKALPKFSDTTMVVAVLIANMAFQVVVSPPGGVWQEDTSSHRAGDAVMASTHPNIFRHFVRANTTAFVSALITIFLITTRQPSGRIFFLLFAVYATWVSLASIAVSYGASIMAITPNTETQSLVPIIIAVVVVSLCIMGFILISSCIRQLHLSWKRKIREQHDLTTDSLIRQVFYLIFQLLDPVEDHKLETVLGLVLRGSAPNSSAARI